MTTIFDADVTGMVSKLGGNILGEAHEYFVTARCFNPQTYM